MDESTTGKPNENSGGEKPLPEGIEPSPADKKPNDAASGGNTQDDADQGKGNDDSNTDDKPAANTDDDGLAKFAKSQGFDPANLTDGERRALKIAHDNQREFHKKRQEEADKLRDSVADLHDPKKATEGIDDDYEKEQAQIRAELNQLKQYQRVNEFWNKNPDAREYEEDMNALILKEKEENGVEAAIYLSRNLDRVYKLAKADRTDPESLKDAGRREEREELRRKQEASADSGSASNSGTSRNTGKVDQDWIDNVYDPSNKEHRTMLDAYLSRG